MSSNASFARSPNRDDGGVDLGLTVTPVLVLGATMVVGLLAAMLGVFSLATVIPGTLILALFAVRGLRGRAAVTGSRRHLVILFAVVTAITLFNGAHRSEFVFSGRDGGTYFAVAAHLNHHGDLLPEVVVEPFEESDDLTFESPGFVLRDDGRVYQQFMHAVPAVFAIGGELVGPPGILVANALLGGVALWAVFGLADRLGGRAVAWGTVATLSACYPFVYFARSTFTEVAMMAVVAAGILLALSSVDEKSTRLATLAGATLGLAPLIRIDGWFVSVAVAWFPIAWTVLSGHSIEPELRSTWAALWRSHLAVIAIAGVDLMVYSSPYAGAHRPEILALITTTLLGRLVGDLVMGGRLRRLPELAGRHRAGIARLSMGGLGLFFAYVTILRPAFVTSEGPTYGMSDLELAAGLPVGSGRDYAELSFEWLNWYLGLPLVLMAVIMLVAAVGASVYRPRPGVLLPLLVLVPPLLVYLWAPSANPDHPWVMRRYLPVVLPGMAILAWGAARLAWTRFRARWRLPAGTALAALLILPPALTTAPLATVIEGSGSLDLLEDVCTETDGNPVLFSDTENRSLLTFFGPPIRAVCGVPAASQTTIADANAWTERGVAVVAPGSPDSPGTDVDGVTTFVVSTLLEPPSTTEQIPVALDFDHPEGS